MTRMIVAAAALACGCTAMNPRSPPIPVTAASADGDACTARTQALVGQPSSDQLIARARALTSRALVRVIGPEDMVTMDHRPDRLSIKVDAEGTIRAIGCY